jgi:hypothetical protein
MLFHLFSVFLENQVFKGRITMRQFLYLETFTCRGISEINWVSTSAISKVAML